MTRLRTNFKKGTITDAPLTDIATTINSAGFASLPVVAAPDTLALILDPEGAAGDPEVVIVTAHTAAATSLTAVRGQEGTVGREHVATTLWKHGPTVADFTRSPINDVAWSKVAAGNILDDEFNDASLAAAWVQIVPSGTQVVAENADALSVKVKANTAEHVCCVVKPIGAFAIGNYIETCARAFTMQNYLMCGLVMTNGTLTTSLSLWQHYQAWISTNTPQVSLNLRTGAVNGTKASLYAGTGVVNGPVYQRLHWVAANSFKAEWSIDGVSWSDFGQGNKAYTFTPTHIGLGTSTWAGAQDSLASYEYFRVG